MHLLQRGVGQRQPWAKPFDIILRSEGPPGIPRCDALQSMHTDHAREYGRSPYNILDFKGFNSSRTLISRGGILMSIGKFPGKFESTNLSRDNLSREIWFALRSPRLPEARRRVESDMQRFKDPASIVVFCLLLLLLLYSVVIIMIISAIIMYMYICIRRYIYIYIYINKHKYTGVCLWCMYV